MKGWIALDIDGTITLDKYAVPDEVIDYLRSLQKGGWNIALSTGRPFSFAFVALKKIDFPFLFLCQNGSIALEMPSQKVLLRSYIPKQNLTFIEKAYEGIGTDFLIYAGFEHGDFCFWRPEKFSSDEIEYLLDLQTRQNEKWRTFHNFNDLDLEAFPLIKCFGAEEKINQVEHALSKYPFFEVTNIRDPFVEGIRILLVTDKNASKGKSLSEIFSIKGRGYVIAAGDDENDLSLLQVADTKIAMAHAPKSLTQAATFIAPPTKDHGIIQALELAIRNYGT